MRAMDENHSTQKNAYFFNTPYELDVGVNEILIKSIVAEVGLWVLVEPLLNFP